MKQILSLLPPAMTGPQFAKHVLGFQDEAENTEVSV